MTVAVTAAAALLPSLLLTWFFATRDVNREPARVLLATFALGMVIAIPVLVVALPLGAALRGVEDPYLAGCLTAFACAALPEEAFKLLVVRGYAARHPAFDEPMDGVVYGVVASLGFATLENVLYTLQGGLTIALLRAFTAVPGHAFMGAIMGYYVGQARFGEPARRGRRMVAAFAVPVVLHTAYDAPLLSMQHLARADVDTATALALVGTVLLVLVGEGVIAVRLAGRLRREQFARSPAARGVFVAPGLPPALAPLVAPGLPPALAPLVAPVPAAAAPYPPPAPVPYALPAPASYAPPASVPYAPPAQAPSPAAAPYPAQTPWQAAALGPAPARPPFLAPAPGAGPPAGLPSWVTAPLPEPDRPRGRGFVGWLLLLLGGLIATAGGLLVVAAVAAMCAEDATGEDVRNAAIGGAIVGVLPALLGLGLFRAGLRRGSGLDD